MDQQDKLKSFISIKTFLEFLKIFQLETKCQIDHYKSEGILTNFTLIIFV